MQWIYDISEYEWASCYKIQLNDEHKNSDLRWAFDLDLLIRLSKIGKLQFMNFTLGSFRWHDGSLSVGGRDGSVREASSVRKHFLPNSLKPLSELWEGPMRYVIKYVGMIVSRRSVSPLA